MHQFDKLEVYLYLKNVKENVFEQQYVRELQLMRVIEIVFKLLNPKDDAISWKIN